MIFVWPWTFLALAPVAVVALLALFRPRRNLVVVASLSLWEEAISSAATTARRKSRRVKLSWFLLLLGALAAVGAGSRPVYHWSGPVRSVAVVLHPSSELGPAGAQQMRAAGTRLLERFDPGDRFELLLPEILGGETGADSRDVLAGLSHLPVSSEALTCPDASPDARHVYHLAISSLDIATGPNVSRIDIPTDLPDVTIDAVGAERIAPDKLQVFAALRNQTDQPAAARLSVLNVLVEGSSADVLDVGIPPKSRKSVTTTMTPVDAIELVVPSGDDRAALAYLVRSESSVRKVAIIGRDDPYLRRFIKVDPTLQLVPSPADAEIVIANGVSAPAGKPALVIAPPTPPPGWRMAGQNLDSVMLSAADVTAGDPIIRGVDLNAAAIRSVRPWVRGDTPGGGVLIGYKGSVLAVRSGGDTGDAAPRRVCVAFDLSENNCTLVRSGAYVVWLANVMRYLAPGTSAGDEYHYSTPLQAGANPAWKTIVRDERFDASALEEAGLTAPGIFRDVGGRLRAVSLVGLKSAPVAIPPDRAIAELTLPEVRPLTRGVELWSVLLAAAGALWLAGWSVAALRD